MLTPAVRLDSLRLPITGSVCIPVATTGNGIRGVVTSTHVVCKRPSSIHRANCEASRCVAPAQQGVQRVCAHTHDNAHTNCIAWQRIGWLSGGEQKRVGIAVFGLLSPARIVVLDEVQRAVAGVFPESRSNNALPHSQQPGYQVPGHLCL